MNEPNPSEAFVAFLNGGYGVGKSTTLDHVGDRLAAAGRPFCLMDVDWFHRSWPPAGDDPHNVATEATNLAAVWQNYRRAGPRQLVVCGVIQHRSDRERYERIFGLPIRSIRLEASPEVAEGRLRHRYEPHRTDALDWHLGRYEELARRLSEVAPDESVIDTDEMDPQAVADAAIGFFELGERGAAATSADRGHHGGVAEELNK